MRVYDLILKKRNGSALSKTEINYLISGYVNGSIPDYQMSALAMAIYFQGMTAEEALNLTLAMINSGETISLSEIPGIKVDKHSTGGVGDTTTLVLAPLVAAAGAPVAKLSGRGLGHTGGTLDKLEAIPGLRTEMSIKELITAVKGIGVAVAGQTGNLVPADKLFYALRDVTATVDSMALIAASIMSKKLAAGSDALVLDVKCGDGAFIKDRGRAFELARTMVDIGCAYGRKTAAVVSNMDQPLGRAIGNALEIEEAVMTLRGEGPADLEELCLVLGGRMLFMANKVPDPDQGRAILKEVIENGSALRKFKDLIRNQHGNDAVTEDLTLLPRAVSQVKVKAPVEGLIGRLRAEIIGAAAMTLGAGREKIDSEIDPSVGITVEKKVGERVKEGETLAVIYAGKKTLPAQVDSAREMVVSAYEFTAGPVEKQPLIYGIVEEKGRLAE